MFMARKDFKDRELDSKLKKIFINKKIDYFSIDRIGLRSRSLRAILQYGMDNGLLERERNLEEDVVFGEDKLDYIYSYYLTDNGKRYFEVEK